MSGSPEPSFATDSEELRNLLAESIGYPPDNRGVWRLEATIAQRGWSIRQYIDDVRPRIRRLAHRPHLGFFLFMAEGIWSVESAAAAPASPISRNGYRRCAQCSGTGKAGTEYCQCSMGRELKKVE